MLSQAGHYMVARPDATSLPSWGQESSQKPLTHQTSGPGLVQNLPATTEVQTMVDQNTEDAALYNKKHPFSLKRRRHLDIFKIIDLIMVKWVATCQVSQEASFSLSGLLVHSGQGFHLKLALALDTGIPSPGWVSPKTRETSVWLSSVGTQEPQHRCCGRTRSNVWFSQSFHGYPRPRIKNRS